MNTNIAITAIISEIKALTDKAACHIKKEQIELCQNVLKQRQNLLEQLFDSVTQDSALSDKQLCADLGAFIERQDKQVVLQCQNLHNAQKEKIMKQRKVAKGISHYGKLAK